MYIVNDIHLYIYNMQSELLWNRFVFGLFGRTSYHSLTIPTYHASSTHHVSCITYQACETYHMISRKVNVCPV